LEGKNPRDAQRDNASEQTEEVAEITRSYGNYHNTFLMVSANMPTAVETAVRRTAVMSALKIHKSPSPAQYQQNR
jgi:hypothetical protein